MLRVMISRGPDGTQTARLPQYGCLGHNRLAVIDLQARAAQPMWDHAHRYCLTFNGEIYNYRELRQTLSKLGHPFHTTADSEVLIQAWAEWGVEAIERLQGMFAFAIWDALTQKLFLVRDRMGEKPLYYAPIQQHFQNGLIFASELKGLLPHPFLKKSLSATALNHYLSFNYTSTADSIFQGIHKLPPASYLIYDANTYKVAIKAYWSLADCFRNKASMNFVEAQEALSQLLADIVKETMVADVPVGAFLSGGVDSAVIAGHMQHNHTQQVRTYSIGFQEKTYSELPLSQQTASYLGTHHTAQSMTPDTLKLLSQWAVTFDEPFADASWIPMYFLCALAKNEVTVSLSGDGGDELFGGYTTYQADRYHRWLRYSPQLFKKGLHKLSHYLPTSFGKVSLDYKIKQFLRGNLLGAERAHLCWREIFSQEQKQSLLREDRHEWLTYSVCDTALSYFQEVSDCHYLDQAMYVDMKTWLVDDILVKVDRAAMAHGLEVRAPFLNHRLVEFAASMPVHYKIKGKQGKRILRHSHEKCVQATILHQPKSGFNSPISNWLQYELYEMAYDVTTSAFLSQWFNRQAIEKMWFEHRRGVCDNGHRLFNLFCLGLWYQHYVKEL